MPESLRRTETHLPVPPSASDLLVSLCRQWQSARKAGVAVSPAEVCKEHPELQGDLERAVAVLSLFGEWTPEAAATATVAFADPTTVMVPVPTGPTDRYGFRGELARGGMGVVHTAHDAALDREVAIKVLHDRYAGRADVARRFVAEARIAGRLQHPGIPPVHDLGTLPDGRPFLAMKLIRGQTLDALLKARPNPAVDLPRFIEIFEKVCQTVGYAHANKILHRDVKPANVMVGAFGEVQVMDWGLAKELTDDLSAGSNSPELPSAPTTVDSGLTQAGNVLGTAAYMPPEQARGEIGLINRRADVFALGSVLCEILTGFPVYRANSPAELLHKAATADLVEAHARLATCGADAELIGLATTCLSAKLWDRPADAGLVATTVAAYRAGVDERLRKAEVQKAEAAAQSAERRKRRRVQGVLALAVLGLLGLIGAGVWYRAELARQAADRQAAADRAAAINIGEVDQLLAKAMTQTDDPSGWARTLAEAKLTATRGVVEAIDPEVKASAVAAQDRVEQADRHRRFVAELDGIYFRYVETGRLNQYSDSVAKEYVTAFRSQGLDVAVNRIPVAALTEFVRTHPHRSAVAEAITDWKLHTIDPQSAADLFAVWVAAVQDLDPILRDLIGLAQRKFPVPETLALLERTDPSKLSGWVIHRIFCDTWNAGHSAAASDMMRRALRVYPNDYRLLTRFGNCLRWTGDKQTTEESTRYLMAAVSLRPGSFNAVSNLAGVLFDRGETAAGRQWLYHAADHLPSDFTTEDRAKVWTEFGDVFRQAKLWDDAQLLFRRATSVVPNYFTALAGLVVIELERRNLPAAERALADFVVHYPDHPFGRETPATIAFHRRDYSKAIALAEANITRDPSSPMSYNTLGASLAYIRQYSQAVVAFRNAIRLNPTNGEYHMNLGWSLAALRDGTGAITAFTEAKRLDPKRYADLPLPTFTAPPPPPPPPPKLRQVKTGPQLPMSGEHKDDGEVKQP